MVMQASETSSTSTEDSAPLDAHDTHEQVAFQRSLQQALAGSELAPAHYESFTRLSKTLIHGTKFQFILAELYSEPLRDRLIALLAQMLQIEGLRSTILTLSRHEPTTHLELEARLHELSQTFAVIHLCGVDAWLDRELHPDRWRDLNVRRDAIATRCRARLVWWVSPEQIRHCAELAPDLWSWRSGIYSFPENPEPPPIAAQFAPDFDPRPLPEKGRRLSQLSAWLAKNPPAEIRIQLLDEQASIWQQLGQWEKALGALQEELALCEALKSIRDIAMTHGRIADIWQAQGKLDKALRIRQEQELPVYERLGDLHAAAITHEKIADIWQARGKLDEALRIRQEQELPVYERLGDLRAAAITHGKIADIWQARGQLDEALRIRQEQELPVFERLGDIRNAAITHEQIADIWQAYGQLDEALRIRQEQVLPVFERLGDIRNAAITHAKIAHIWQARGKLDEALRICQGKVLPILEQLGDRHSLLVAQANLGIILLQRAKGNDVLEAKRWLLQALQSAEELQLPNEIAQIQSVLVTLPETN